METDTGECNMHSLVSTEEKTRLQEWGLSNWPVYEKKRVKVSDSEEIGSIKAGELVEDIRKKRGEFEKRSPVKLDEKVNVNNTGQQNLSNERFQSSIRFAGKADDKKNLLDREREIIAKVHIIVYENRVYFYNDRTYQIIHTPEELMSMVRERVRYDAFGCTTTDLFRHLLKFMQSDKTRIPENCEERIAEGQYYVVFRNGVLDLRTLKLHKHSSEYLTFYELQTNWTEDRDAPTFRKFLETSSDGDGETKERIMEAMGYMLTALNYGKCFFVMGNAPNSGKSTIGKLLIKLLGEDLTITRSINQLGGRFGLADIEGKILNLCMDLPNGKIPRETVSEIKCITGGDKVTIEGKFRDYTQIHSNMKFLFASNFPVVVAKEEDDDSFWDRMVIVPFLYSVTRKQADLNLISELIREKEQIISLCLKRVSKLIRNNFMFSPCCVADRLKENWRYCVFDSSGTAQQFMESCLAITGNDKDYIYTSEVYEGYRKFCANYGFDPLLQNTLIQWICANEQSCVKRRYHETGKNAMSAIRGVTWKNEGGSCHVY